MCLGLLITPSQNHRLMEAGRALSRLSGPTPPHSSRATERTMSRRLCGICEDRDSIPGQPGPVLEHLHSSKVFPALETELRITSSTWTKLELQTHPIWICSRCKAQSTTQRKVCMLPAQGFLFHIPQSVPPCAMQAVSVLPAPKKLSKSRSDV